MTTPQDNKLATFLEEMKKVGENATPGPWKPGRDDMDSFDMDGVHFKNCYTSVDNDWIRSCTENSNEDAKFIATARNNWEKLIKLNEILLEACEFYSHSEEFESLKESYKHDKSKVVVDFYGDIARKAIEKCKEIIG